MEDVDLGKNLNAQQARVEDITLKEDFGTFVATQEDDFGDMGSFGMDMDTFMISDLERGRQLESGSLMMGENENGLDFFDDQSANKSNFDMSKNKDIQPMDLNDLNNDLNANGGLMDSTLGNQVTSFTTDLDQPNYIIEDTLDEIHDTDATMEIDTAAVVPNLFDDNQTVNQTDEVIPAVDELVLAPQILTEDLDTTLQEQEATSAFDQPPVDIELAPAVASTVVEKQSKTRRKIRKLIIDDVKEIDSASMKTQLSDTSNILGQLELAPPTRRLMQLKETSGVDKMFSLTSRPLHNKTLLKLYTRNMFTTSLADITNHHPNTSHKQTLNKPVKDTQSTINEPPPAVKPLTTDNPVTSILANIAAATAAPSYIEEPSMEASVNGGQMSRSTLGMDGLGEVVQSEINDESRQRMTDLSRQLNDELDEFEQMGGPMSVFNNTNVDDMLAMGDLGVVLDETPAEVVSGIEKKVNEEGSDEVESEEEEVVDSSGVRVKKSPTKSPTAKKRHYRKSLNATLSKLDDVDETLNGEESLDASKALTKRAKTMVSVLNKCFHKTENVGFFELARRNVRKHAAQKFYSLLVLKKFDIIEVTQTDTYGDIIICKGDKFSNFAHH